MARADIVRAMVEPLAEEAGADVYDVTMNADTLVVAITKPGGIDLETITTVARQLNAELDEKDPINGSYTLEVTSPGLERTLRTPEHFTGAIGDDVTIRTKPDVEGERRVRGVVRSIDGDTVTIALEDDAGDRTLSLDQIERARTVFTWGGDDQSAKPAANKKARS